MVVDLINFIIEHFNYETYLEIDVGNPENVFNYVQCNLKYGVDPKLIKNHNGTQMWKKTSNQLFSYLPLHHRFDIIFINSSYIYLQAKQNIYHSIKHLSNDGTIILSDCIPSKKGYSQSGVWQAFLEMKCKYKYSSLNFFVVNVDSGIGIIKSGVGYKPEPKVPSELRFSWLKTNQDNALRLVSYDPAEILQQMENN